MALRLSLKALKHKMMIGQNRRSTLTRELLQISRFYRERGLRNYITEIKLGTRAYILRLFDEELLRCWLSKQPHTDHDVINETGRECV